MESSAAAAVRNSFFVRSETSFFLRARAGRAMPPKKKAPSTSLGFYPMLKKTAVAVGKQCSVPGKYWAGCSVMRRA